MESTYSFISKITIHASFVNTIGNLLPVGAENGAEHHDVRPNLLSSSESESFTITGLPWGQTYGIALLKS